MEWDCAMAVLCLLPESLAHQDVAAPLRHMAHVRVVQEFCALDPALADPAKVARLQQLPAEALLLLLLSPELGAWGEGAVLAAVDLWMAGPVGSAATPEQLATIGAAVRLPLVPGPLLAAAAVMMPAAAFATWPLEQMRRYYSADLEERYLMTRALLDAGADVPWSAVRRTRAAAEGLTAACGQARLFQLRRLHEQTQAWDDTRGGTCAGAGAAPALELGRASFGGYEWRAALVCCMEPPAAEGGQEPGEDGSAAGAGPRQDADRLATSRAAAMSVPWRLGLRIAASPLLGRRASMDAAPAGPQHDSEGGHAGGGAVVGGAALAELLAIGATKAAAAVGRHFPPDAPAADAPAGAAFPEELAVAALGAAVPAGAACGTREGGGARHSACQAFDVVAGVCVEVAERQEQLAEPAGGGGRAFAPLLLALSCAGAAGGAWCLRAAGRAGARGCGLCRSGVVGDALAAAGGGDAAVTAFAEWQPERWSALAPAGQLHWRCGLRLLTDY